MIQDTPVNTDLFPDLDDDSNEDFVSSQLFMDEFITNGSGYTSDAMSGQSSDSETDGSASGVEICGSDFERESQWDSGQETTSGETDTGMEVETKKVEETKKKKKKIARKVLPKDFNRYYTDSETDDDDSINHNVSEEKNIFKTLMEFRNEQEEIEKEDEANYPDLTDEEERHKWKLTGEFSIGGFNYRPSDYIEVITEDNEVTMFYQIQRINMDEKEGSVECRCYKLYKPSDTILGNISKYCDFHPKELFLYYPDERSCREVINGNRIIRRITVNNIYLFYKTKIIFYFI